MLINTSDDMYWTVGNKVYYDKILAIDESLLSNQPVKFYFYNNTLEKFNWSTDYTTLYTWNELLRLRAEEIRSKWNKINIWYTGGRDSYLVLKTFADNNITVDEVCMIDFNYALAEHKHTAEYITEHKHLYPNVKKWTVIKYDLELQRTIMCNKNRHDFQALPICTTAEMSNHHRRKDPNSATTCNITGAEKSRLYFDNGEVHACMYDVTINNMMGIENHEPFFISETLPVFQYQSWHLLNFIKTNPIFQHYTVQELNGRLYSAPKDNAALYDTDHPYYIACVGLLRTEYANIYTGLPWHKIAREGIKLDNPKYVDLLQQWKSHHPEIYKSYRDNISGIMDPSYINYFDSNDVNRHLKGITSKFHTMGKYIK